MRNDKWGRPTGRPLPPETVAPHEMWMYSVDGPRLFAAGETIPSGYSDSPEKVKVDAAREL